MRLGFFRLAPQGGHFHRQLRLNPQNICLAAKKLIDNQTEECRVYHLNAAIMFAAGFWFH